MLRLAAYRTATSLLRERKEISITISDTGFPGSSTRFIESDTRLAVSPCVNSSIEVFCATWANSDAFAKISLKYPRAISLAEGVASENRINVLVCYVQPYRTCVNLAPGNYSTLCHFYFDTYEANGG